MSMMSAEVFAFETDVTAHQRGWPDYNIPSAESVYILGLNLA